MKIWKWYKVPPEEHAGQLSNLSVEDKYPLYAFTDDKKLRDLFRETRNTEKFIEMKSDIDKEEFVAFANHHNGCQLKMYDFDRFIKYPSRAEEDDPPYEPEFETVQVLATWSEREITQSALETFSDSGGGQCAQTYPFSPLVFQDKYVRALELLQYIKFWTLYSSENVSDMEEFMLAGFNIDIDYSYPDVTYDEFAAFINLFADVLA